MNVRTGRRQGLLRWALILSSASFFALFRSSCSASIFVLNSALAAARRCRSPSERSEWRVEERDEPDEEPLDELEELDVRDDGAAGPSPPFLGPSGKFWIFATSMAGGFSPLLLALYHLENAPPDRRSPRSSSTGNAFFLFLNPMLVVGLLLFEKGLSCLSFSLFRVFFELEKPSIRNRKAQ